MIQPPDDRTLDDDAPIARPPEEHHREIVAGSRRYTDLNPIGAGGFARVFEARSQPTGERVAVKLMRAATQAHRERADRELAALRRLQGPGVVRLLDDARAGDDVILVMERVVGRPFGAAPWEELRTLAIAVLEIVARVHEAGYAHLDLKPGNVLVRESGAPVLLDFGLARAVASPELAPAACGAGTRPYMAPEQHSSRSPGPPADLYALGVMFYEALSGRRPTAEHEGPDPAPGAEPPTLMALDPTCPPAFSKLVQRLLDRDPQRRPTARQALLALHGQPLRDPHAMPWTDRQRPLDEIARDVRAGRWVTVGGPPGSGRTRLLLEIADRLGAVAWTVSARHPFGSLGACVETIPSELDADAASAEVAARLAALGRPLLVDDPEALDPWTRALLESQDAPGHGVRIVATGASDVHLGPWSEGQLEGLFLGPDRVVHLREDAARELHRRTEGLARRVAAQLADWTRDGVAIREDGGWRVARDTLDRLAEEQITPGDHQDLSHLASPLRELLGWIAFCWPHTSIDVLREITGQPRWELELILGELARLGLVVVEGLAARPVAQARPAWTDERRRLAHTAMGRILAPGAEGRLRHLREAGATHARERQALRDEVLLVARRAVEEGRLTRAAGVLEDALHVQPGDEALLMALAAVQIERHDRIGVDQVRLMARERRLQDLERLLSGVRHAWDGRGAAAEAELEGSGETLGPWLEGLRLAALVRAADSWDHEQKRALLRRLEQHPLVRFEPEQQARWETWWGRLLFDEGDLDGAAAAHLRAASRRRGAGALASLINAGRACIAGADWDTAEQIAAQALPRAIQLRHWPHEAAARWLTRAAANGRGAREPDLELVEAIQELRGGMLAAEAAITEAFIAWRGGHPEALHLASRALSAFSGANNTVAALHARALCFALGAGGDGAALAMSAAQLHGLPLLALDVLALLTEAGQAAPPEAIARLTRDLNLDTLRPGCRGAFSPADALRRLI